MSEKKLRPTRTSRPPAPAATSAKPTPQPAMWRSRTTSRVALMAVTHATVADSDGCGAAAAAQRRIAVRADDAHARDFEGSATHVAFCSSSSASPAV